MVKLTPLEMEVLSQLYDSSWGNGHDFGLTDDVKLANPRSLGGVISSLVQKNIIEIHDEFPGLPVQFTFVEIQLVEKILGK